MAGRPSKWNSPTESVRLPSHLIPRLIQFAQILDQPIPTNNSDEEFQQYLNFVQNSVQPKLVSIRDSEDDFKERNYIVQSPLLSFDEWQQLEQVSARIEAEVLADLNDDDRLYLLSLMVQDVFPEHLEGDKDDANG